MRAPAFWWKPAPDALALMLSPLAAIYGAATARRMRRSGARVGAPVICVGNFVAGGAGKTPAAIALARALAEAGRTPFFLSRGYGAQTRDAAPLLVDAARHSAAKVGDEPLLLARVAPTIVCADRVAGARFAVAAGAGVIVMDDGLQNASLAKDFTIAVADGAVGVGNGLCIPAGPLRAPLDTQWPLVDALIVIGEGEPGERLAAQAMQRDRAPRIGVTRARLCPDKAEASRLRGARALAFAGIGRPEKFFATLRSIGVELAATRAFADHHAYSQAEIEDLRREAERLGAILLTTEKDLVRIAGPESITALAVSLKAGDGDFADLARAALARASA